MRSDPKRDVKRALRQTGVRPSKTRGQNFLIDEAFISEIISFANPDLNEKIVEIGPGLGALTKELADAKDLTLIEIEPEFCRELQAKYPHAKIINKDVRTVNFSEIGENLIVFGNLPYVYSTEIIFNLIDNKHSVRKAVFLLQQEFAERLAAKPGGKVFGVLSISAQLWADIRLGGIIKGDAFVPPTKVNSRLVELTFLKECRFAIPDYMLFKKVVKAAFIQRRKKLINSMASTGFFKKDQLEEALKACSIDPGRRAETLSIEEFVNLAKTLA